MYNSGDNRLGPAGHGFTGYDIVGEFLKAILPAEDPCEQSPAKSGAKLSSVRNFIRNLRNSGPDESSRQNADTAPIYSSPSAQHNC